MINDQNIAGSLSGREQQIFLRNRLREIVIGKSMNFAPADKPFILTSGLTSSYYINGKRTTADPEGLFCLSRLIYEKIKETQVEAIGGPTMGADPIAGAVTLFSQIMGNPIPLFIVRKESKKHGTQSQIEGCDITNKKVVIVEDVITTGGSVLKAIEAVKACNAEVLEIIALVDREQGGVKAFDEAGISYNPIFSISELLPQT